MPSETRMRIGSQTLLPKNAVYVGLNIVVKSQGLDLAPLRTGLRKGLIYRTQLSLYGFM